MYAGKAEITLRNIGIKYQLRLTTIIPVAVVAILFAVFYNGQFSKDLTNHMSRLGEAYIRQLLPAAQFALLKNDSRTLQGLINASTVNPEVRALAFYNANGDLIAYRGGRHMTHLPFKQPNFTGDTIESNPINSTTINFIAPISIPRFNLFSSSPFPQDTKMQPTYQAYEILGWLSLDIDTQSMLVKRYKMYIITLFITLSGLLLSLSVHFFLSKRIYLPITRLRRSMKQILRNEFETHIRVTSHENDFGIIEKGAAHLQEAYLNSMKELNHHIEVATADLQQSLELLEEKNIDLSLEKRKTEERSKQKSEFIANMSHEIRTPMNGILGFTNLLVETQLDGLQLEYVKTIQSSAKELLSTINDILDYSKMEAGKLDLDCIPFDIRKCIDEVLALAAPISNKKGVDLIPLTAANVPKTMLGDPLRVKQILTNLVNNALKFTDHGYVLIRTEIEQETDHQYTLVIHVIDTGVGISKEDQAKLFNAFNQADTSITRRYGGSGLGLVICKKLTECMGGRITLDSELNKGSTFKAVINIEKFKAYEVEKNQTHRLSHLKVLCFDDNPLFLESLCLGLSAWGIESVPISHFNQLQLAFRKHQDCHLAIVNVNQGCEQQVAQIITKTQIPSIFVSRWPIQEPERFGAKGFLFKPINMQKLHETLEKYANIDSLQHQDTQLVALRTQMRELYPHILVAEDNPVNRLLLESLLSDYAKITTVEDGEQALNIAQKHRFDLIMLDFQMPKMNGLHAAQNIKHHQMQNTPIILISANITSEMKEALLRNDIDLFLQKPVDESTLLSHILELLHLPKTNLIDWEKTLKKLSGNDTLAKDYLNSFIDELKQSAPKFQTLFESQNYHELGLLFHKIRGACCFCHIPALESELSTAEDKIYAKQYDKLEPHLHQIQQLIEAIHQEHCNHDELAPT